MSATTKPEFHPDAESLNAFAEQALAEKERSQMLTHLAVCGRCRQVIALAREAADAEVASPATGRHAALQPDAWWKRWRLVWVPTAAVAAFTVASISISVHQTHPNSATTKIAEQSNEQSDAGAANSSQPEQAQAALPSSPATAMPKPKAEKPTSAGRAQAAHSFNHETSTELDRLTPAKSPPQPPPPNAQAQQLDAGLVPAERPSDSAAVSAQSAMGAFREEPRKQQELRLQTEAQVDGLPPAAPAPATAHAATGAPSPHNTAAVASNRQFEMSSGSLATFSSMNSSLNEMKVARAKANINLPSGQPAVSTSIAGRRMLAIDKEGTLFLSEDAGDTWDHVTRQWTGRATMVRRHAPLGATAGAAPNTQQLEAAPSDAGGSPAPAPVPASASESTPVPAPAPLEFFEILNDKNQVWLSTDGRLWIAQ